MSVKVIRALLVANAATTAVVPAERIVAGVIPADMALPALSLTHISTVPIGAIDASAEFSLVRSRVQVTVVTVEYPAGKELADVVRRACNFERGLIAGLEVASITRDTVGPDYQNQAGDHFGSIDFMVTYHEQN
jgi:hypothetical protein